MLLRCSRLETIISNSMKQNKGEDGKEYFYSLNTDERQCLYHIDILIMCCVSVEDGGLRLNGLVRCSPYQQLLSDGGMVQPPCAVEAAAGGCGLLVEAGAVSTVSDGGCSSPLITLVPLCQPTNNGGSFCFHRENLSDREGYLQKKNSSLKIFQNKTSISPI